MTTRRFLGFARLAAAAALVAPPAGLVAPPAFAAKPKPAATAMPKPAAAAKAKPAAASLAPTMAVPSPPPPVPSAAELLAAPGARAITLADALAAAAARNLSLLAARQQVMAASAGLDSANATRFPTLSAEGNAANPNGGPATSASGGMTLAYDLDTHGARSARIKLGQVQRAIADASLAQASQAVRFEAIAAFYDMQNAAEQVRIAALNLANARTSVDDAQTQRAAGEATEFDVQRAKVQYGAAEQGLADARGQLTIARRRMARVLGLDPRETLVPAGAVEPVADWPLSLEASLAQALARRPELRLRELEREAAQENAKMAYAARGMQTSLFANGDAATVGPGLGGGAFAGWPPGANYTVGARASWLLVDWGTNGQLARQAEIGAEIAETQRRDAALQVQLDVEQAHASMTAARANIRSADLALAVARQGLESARLRFKGGVGTQTDVLLAQADLVQAESNRVRAVLAFNRAIAQLEQLSAAQGLPEPR